MPQFLSRRRLVVFLSLSLSACRIIRCAAIAVVTFASFTWSGMQAAQADPFLDEIVEFTGQVLYLEYEVPALVIGAVRNGEISVRGFGANEPARVVRHQMVTQ